MAQNVNLCWPNRPSDFDFPATNPIVFEERILTTTLSSALSLRPLRLNAVNGRERRGYAEFRKEDLRIKNAICYTELHE